MSTTQLEKNIAYCIDDCDMSDDQIGEMLRCIEHQKLASVEHFCEEFIFECDDVEDWMTYHDKNYLNIAEINAIYWSNHA
tara:strand:- start:3743 stop:3982 length:240 start_codon:yes stop_codon:yes gene_type:complete